MNNAIPWIIYVEVITYTKKIPFFLHNLKLFVPVRLAVFFCDRNLLNMCFLTTSKYKRVKRNKNPKNPWHNNVGNNMFSISCCPSNTLASSNFLPSIKYIILYYLYFNIIYLIQLSPQFTSAPWSNTSRKYFLNFKHAKHINHAILWSMPTTPFYEIHQPCHFMKHAKFIEYASM